MINVWIRRTLFVFAFVIVSSGSWAADQTAQPQADKPGDSTSVLARVRPLAEQGDPKAQYNMGVIYDRGYGVERDYDKALSWYEKAAAQGDAEAAHNLGVMYHAGHGVPVNNQRAVYWFKKAAKLGEPAAQNNLAVMYAEGMGVEKDLAQAVAWMARAAAAGNESAVDNLPILAAELPQATVDGDNVNVRAQPGTEADVLAQADADAKVAVLQQANGWSRLLLLPDYVVGWVANSLLTGEQPSAAEPVQEDVAATAVAEPATTAPVGSTEATATGADGAAAVAGLDAAEQPPATESDDIFVADSPADTTVTGQAMGVDNNGAIVADAAQDGDDAPAATVNNESGNNVEAATGKAATKTVGVGTANVRQKPSRQATVLFRLHRGDAVTVIRGDNGWAYVESNDGSRGWVAGYLLVSD